MLSLVYKLFHTVLLYAIKEEEEGWRLWTQTAAVIHVHVSLLVDNVVFNYFVEG